MRYLTPQGVAQSGSAPVLGTGSRRFKSCHPDSFILFIYNKKYDNQNYIIDQPHQIQYLVFQSLLQHLLTYDHET